MFYCRLMKMENLVFIVIFYESLIIPAIFRCFFSLRFWINVIKMIRKHDCGDFSIDVFRKKCIYFDVWCKIWQKYCCSHATFIFYNSLSFSFFKFNQRNIPRQRKTCLIFQLAYWKIEQYFLEKNMIDLQYLLLKAGENMY